MLFYRCTTDKKKYDCTEQVRNHYASTLPGAVWIIGAGPSIRDIDTKLIDRSLAPKMCMNFAGRGRDGEGYLIKPTFWTSFDPTPRWFGSMFNDASITKFLRGGKHLDLVPGTSFKACDCPNTYFVDIEYRYYEHFFKPGATAILHQLDSFVQAIDICFQLGFRKMYCVGTDFIVRPSEPQVELAKKAGVEYENGQVHFHKEVGGGKPQSWWSDRLIDFAAMCKKNGVGHDDKQVADKMEAVDREAQYGCDETKPWRTAVSTDNHYFDTIQYLRLSRRNHSLTGVKIISCTPGSRLNAFFPYQTEVEAATTLDKLVGNPLEEFTSGRLNVEPNPDEGLPYHADIDSYGKKTLDKGDAPDEPPKEEPIAKRMMELNRDIKLDEIA